MTISIPRRRVALLATFLVFLLLVFLVACGDSSSSNNTQPRSTFSMVMFTGDSLTAGFQNGSLSQSLQVHGYAPVLAQQAGFEIIQPLIADPGLPSQLKLISLSPLDIERDPGTSTGRINQLMWPTDVAVPGHTVNDLLTYAPVVPPTSDEDGITDVVLAYPPGNTGTQVEQVISGNPTTVFVWAGNNDALVADFAGTPAAMTPLADFTTQFTNLLSTLHSKTSANLVVANIPDVTKVPYLFPAPIVLAQTQTTLAGYGVNLDIPTLSVMMGITAGDYVNLDPGVQTEVPAFVKALLTGGTPVALSDTAVLTAAEAVQVQANVDAYNAVIAAQTTAVSGTLVDIHALFAAIGDCRIPGIPCSGGVTVNGYQLTNAFVTGGIFSLDGIHPTNTGYAIIANTFIDAINPALGTSVADADISAIAAADPLFPPNLMGGATKAKKAQMKGAPAPKGIPSATYNIFRRK